MTRAIQAYKNGEEREDGFTLIELLVVVIIIGILAAIAIPAFLNQRERAYQSSIESDTRNAAIAIETAFTAADEYPVNNAAIRAATSNNWSICDDTATSGNVIIEEPPCASGDEVATFSLSDNSQLSFINGAGLTPAEPGTYEIEGCHDLLDTSGDCSATFEEFATYLSDEGGLQ